MLLDLLYPPRCAACDQLSQATFCATCDLSATPLIGACSGCGLPMDEAAGGLCGRCRRSRGPVDRVWTAFELGGAVRSAVHRFKYRARPDLAVRFGPHLPDAGDWDAIVPVPLHRRRLRARGYNQAASLARVISKLSGVPARYRALDRIRDTPSQTARGLAARATNVRGAFVHRSAEPLDGRTVLLVDDVITSGATIAECARTLRRAGVGRIEAFALARGL